MPRTPALILGMEAVRCMVLLIVVVAAGDEALWSSELTTHSSSNMWLYLGDRPEDLGEDRGSYNWSSVPVYMRTGMFAPL